MKNFRTAEQAHFRFYFFYNFYKSSLHCETSSYEYMNS